MPNKRGEDTINSDITATIEPKEVYTIVGAVDPAVIDNRKVSIAVEPKKVKCIQTNSILKAVVNTEDNGKNRRLVINLRTILMPLKSSLKLQTPSWRLMLLHQTRK